MFFGEYLIQRGLMTEEDLHKALDIQTSERTPLGQLAVEQSFLNRKDLFRVLNEQRKTKEKSKRFGDVAVELGIMTEKQLNELLKIQAENRKLIGAILVSTGVISGAQLVEALKGFKDLKEKEKE